MSLKSLLSEYSLDGYFENFIRKGIKSPADLSKIGITEYASFGVVNLTDRKLLMEAIQRIRSSPYKIETPPTNRRIQAKVTPPSSKRTPIESHIGSRAAKLKLAVNSPLRSPARRLNAYGINEQVTPTKIKSNRNLNLDRIIVCARKRPLNSREIAKEEDDVARVMSRKKLMLLEPKTSLDLSKYIEEHEFVFDHVFSETSTNMDVYSRAIKSLVEYVFEGKRATCFAYGQTGSGKTHTVLEKENGIFRLAANDIFKLKEDSLDIYISAYEIYKGQLYDLLNVRQKVFARENYDKRICISGLKEFKVLNIDDLLETVDRGLSQRSTGVTAANADSSRSHAILQLAIKNRKGRLFGMMSFIDLAGSERGSDRQNVDKNTKLEGAEINRSLLALKECIRAIDQDSKHLPFRQSKLTQVLKDSFIGDSKTCMIATFSPNSGNSEHTLNTLRYADRVKELKSSPEEGEDENENEFEEENDEIDNDATPIAEQKLFQPIRTSKSPIEFPTERRKANELNAVKTRMYGLIEYLTTMVSASDDAEMLELIEMELTLLTDNFEAAS